MSSRHRLLVLAAAVVVLAAVATASVLHAAHRAGRKDMAQAGGPRVAAGHVSLAASPRRLMVFRNMAWGPHRDELATVPAAAPGGSAYRLRRAVPAVLRRRGHRASAFRRSTARCMTPTAPSYWTPGCASCAATRPAASRPARGSRPAAGWSPGPCSSAATPTPAPPSRPVPRSWTRAPGRSSRSLESYAITRDGRAYRAADVNFWGVTFADDTHFYATLATGGRTYLVRGRRRRPYRAHASGERRVPVAVPRRRRGSCSRSA